MKKHLLGVFLILTFINYTRSQCGAINYGSSNLNLVSSVSGTCTYNISVQISNSSGNPSVQFQYRCGSAGAFIDVDPCAKNLTSTLTVYTSNNFTCPCSTTVYAQLSGRPSSGCGGSPCSNTTLTTNLAIGLSSFDIENSDNKKQICLSWSVPNPDPIGTFAVETSEDGITFKNYGTYTHQQTYKGNSSYAVCMENKSTNTYYRLKVIDPSGLVTLSPIRKINFSNSSLAVSVDRNHHRLLVFGLDRADGVPYDIMNMYGQIISKGQLNSTSLELPSISSGMYILRLNLPAKEVPISWIY